MLLDIIPEKVGHKRSSGFTRNSLNQKVASYEPVVDAWVGVDQILNTESPQAGSAERSEFDYILYVDPDYAVDRADRWIVRGLECFVVGIPEPIRNMFTGDAYHVEIKVRRAEG